MVFGRDVVLMSFFEGKPVALQFCGCTLRDKSILYEKRPCIEGEGGVSFLRESAGVTGGLTTLLSCESVNFLFSFAFGENAAGYFESGTKDLHRKEIRLLASDISLCFDFILRYKSVVKVFAICRAFVGGDSEQRGGGAGEDKDGSD